MAMDRYDVVGIGNAIVDVLAHTSDSRLMEMGLAKGVMTLIDEKGAETLYQRMEPVRECSGGSAANTIAGIAALEGRTAFMGKVKDDPLGFIFSQDLLALSVHFPTPHAAGGSPTARCLIFVTPDAQRTMQTHLGACVEFSPDDVDEEVVAGSRITYLEGYLWDPPLAKKAFLKAADIAHAAGRKVALSLSDPFCVERHRAELLDLAANHVDILFANEDEVSSLFQTDFDGAARKAREVCEIAVLTRAARGSVTISREMTIEQPAEPVAKVIDTTGAGDLFAAGFLYGLTRDQELGTCAKMGGVLAAEIIGHVGARPEADLTRLVAGLASA